MKLLPSWLALATLLALLPGVRAACADAPPAALYTNPKATTEARVSSLLARLTLPEKLSLLAFQGYGDPLKLNTPPIERLGLPPLRTTDSANGLRDGPATSFPMGIVLASTWNPDLVRQVGAAVGAEARAKNRQVVYGPCVNIQRSPQNGRTFETYSEDPFLAAQITVGYIQGMQSRSVAACIKHFACNNQETHRHEINVVVGERALHEIYLPAFEAAVTRAHVWSLMPGFNAVNGLWMAQNGPLVTDLVKTDWRWDGLAISDWGAIHETVPAANAGTDIEMPSPERFTPAALSDALAQKQVTPALIDDKVRRLLRLLVRTGSLDPPATPDLTALNSPAHQKLALEAARQGITLLKNTPLKNRRGLLPLDRTKIKSVALIGPNAADTQLGGRWSADVTPFYFVTVQDGLKKALLPGVTLAYAQGCPRTGAGTPAALREAVALAAKSDVAIVVVGMDKDYEGEEIDPPDLHLPGDQDKLIAAVAAVNKKTIVILNNGTPVAMDRWLPHVPALVEAWYSGQETGRAVADVLFGDVNPSGRLPLTLAARREEYSDWGHYPGTPDTVRYDEGIYVGYRHFDKQGIRPLFPFGFGLSYTSFAYSGLTLPRTLAPGGKARVQVTIQNTGHRAGDEVAQLYVRALGPGVDRPVRELKGFGRVSLPPGKKAVATFTLDDRAFSYWDVTRHAWRVRPGPYAIEVGASSRDLRVRGTLQKP